MGALRGCGGAEEIWGAEEVRGRRGEQRYLGQEQQSTLQSTGSSFLAIPRGGREKTTSVFPGLRKPRLRDVARRRVPWTLPHSQRLLPPLGTARGAVATSLRRAVRVPGSGGSGPDCAGPGGAERPRDTHFRLLLRVRLPSLRACLWGALTRSPGVSRSRCPWLPRNST